MMNACARSVREQLHRFGVVLALQLLEVDVLRLLVAAQQRDRRRARRRRHRLAVEVGERLDPRALLHRGGHVDDEVRRPERDLLLAVDGFVVEPHSRSIVPFCSSGMRFAEVTGW